MLRYTQKVLDVVFGINMPSSTHVEDINGIISTIQPPDSYRSGSTLGGLQLVHHVNWDRMAMGLIGTLLSYREEQTRNNNASVDLKGIKQGYTTGMWNATHTMFDDNGVMSVGKQDLVTHECMGHILDNDDILEFGWYGDGRPGYGIRGGLSSAAYYEETSGRVSFYDDNGAWYTDDVPEFFGNVPSALGTGQVTWQIIVSVGGRQKSFVVSYHDGMVPSSARYVRKIQVDSNGLVKATSIDGVPAANWLVGIPVVNGLLVSLPEYDCRIGFVDDPLSAIEDGEIFICFFTIGSISYLVVKTIVPGDFSIQDIINDIANVDEDTWRAILFTQRLCSGSTEDSGVTRVIQDAVQLGTRLTDVDVDNVAHAQVQDTAISNLYAQLFGVQLAVPAVRYMEELKANLDSIRYYDTRGIPVPGTHNFNGRWVRTLLGMYDYWRDTQMPQPVPYYDTQAPLSEDDLKLVVEAMVDDL
jgi:hypothetical protein